MANAVRANIVDDTNVIGDVIGCEYCAEQAEKRREGPGGEGPG